MSEYVNNPATVETVHAEEDLYAFPASSAQRRMWFLDQSAPESGLYNIPFAVRFQGPLSVQALEDSLNQIVQRHEILRTHFEMEDDNLLQVVVPRLHIDLQVVNLERLPAAEREAQVQVMAKDDAARSFDLRHGPLMRAQLLRLGESEHVLLINMHHIISDGWSVGVLNQEMVQLYEAMLVGQSSPLPELELQYADFTLWQQEWMEDGLEQQMAYWREQLGGELPLLQLPTDFPRPAVQRHVGQELRFQLSAPLTERLKKLSREQESTLFMTLYGVYQVLLHRYSGQDDLCVGTPIAGRNRHELEHLIGFFVNTLVLRTSLAGDPTFCELLQRARETALGAYAHQDVPFEKLVEVLQPERDLSRTPLFQVMFALQNAPQSQFEFSGVTLEMVEFENESAKFDLSLTMYEEQNRLNGIFEYDTDLFRRETVERLILHFNHLLEAVVADPSQRLSELPMLSAAERKQLLVDFQNPQPFPWSERTLPDVFREQATKFPDRIAVCDSQHAMTYAELDARTNQIARWLREQGAERNGIVSILMERSVDVAVAILGVLKAGGGYLFLDPETPEERMSFLLEDSAARLVLTHRHFSERVTQPGVHAVCLEEIAGSAEPLELINTSRDLAYVVYTSGSTGRPKGVLLSHRALLHYVSGLIQEYGYCDQDRLLLYSAFTFDASVWDLFCGLLTGGRVYILAGEERHSIAEYAAVVEAQGATKLFAPTVFFHQLVTYLTEEEEAKFSTVHMFFTGSETVSPEAVRKFQRRFGTRIEVMNCYGPTETMITCTHYRMSELLGADVLNLPIGRPLPNADVYILNDQMDLCPVNVIGEICIGGPGLADGYLNLPDKTADVFVPHPFAGEPGARIYKSGDLGRILPDGTIEFAGRRDKQVKIRGFRLELGEIESVLTQHPQVSAALVWVHEDEHKMRRLVAYAAVLDQMVDSAELRTYLRGLLPGYMVPSAIVVLDSLPESANGKIDRRALPEPIFTGTSEGAERVAPRNETEAALAEIWQSLLRVEQVGVHDNFFELGGDSILSIQIINRARQQGIHLTSKDMFKYQTIAELAAQSGTAASARAEQGIVTGEVMLTPIQTWFFEQELHDPHHWNLPLMLDLKQPLQRERLHSVLEKLLMHHDALRMSYQQTEQGWQQINMPPNEQVPLEWVDLSALTVEEQTATLEREAEQWQASLDLAGPLVRFVYFDCGRERAHRLLMVIHHLVVDGISWRILLQDLEELYAQARAGAELQVPLKTTSYQEWVHLLHEYAHESQTLLAEQAYWMQLREQERVSLPLDEEQGVRGANTTASVEHVNVRLSESETQALLQQAMKAYNTQINDLLLTALVESFADWTGSRSLLLHQEGHGREEMLDGVDLSRTVGWFTSLYPILLQLEGTERPGDAIRSVKEQLRAVPNKGIGYGLLRYASNEETAAAFRDLPYPQVSFNYLGQLDQSIAESELFAISDQAGGLPHAAANERAHLIDITGEVVAGQLQLNWSYSRHLHRRETMEQLAQAYLTALRELIAHCCSAPGRLGVTPSDFPLARLSQNELDTFTEQLAARSTPLDAIEEICELSPMQEGMVFHSSLSPDSGVYITQLNLGVRGRLDLDALKQAWHYVLHHHSILRTSFHWQGLPRALQVVHRETGMQIEELDLRTLATEEQTERFTSFLDQDKRIGFDLSAAPLMRLTVVRMNEEESQLIWTSHHVLFDGWSLPLLVRELLAAYESFGQGQRPAFGQAPPFADFIEWLQRQDLAAAEQYWRQRLSGFEAPTVLRVERARISSGDDPASYHELRAALPKETTARLQELTKQHQLTLNTLAQGAWALLLSRYSGETDVLFGATVSGRPADLPGVESMVGLFINTLPMRVQVEGDLHALAYLQSFQQQQAEMREYEFTPLVNVQEWSDVKRGVHLFDSIVAFENYPMNEATLEQIGELQVTGVTTNEHTNYPITIGVLPEEELTIRLSYDGERYDEDTMRRLLGHLFMLMEGLLQDPERKVADVPMVTPREQQELLNWNATTTAFAQDRLVHQLLEEQAERTPDAVALEFGAQMLTYRELNERANRIARWLRERGVGRDSLVGLYMERSLDLVVGLFAVMKSGGAYVPIDTVYPEERVRLILEDTSLHVLLTQEHLLSALPQEKGDILCADRDRALLESYESTNLPPISGPDGLCYLIYTSGSTGRPKAVMIEHSNVLSYLGAAQHHFCYDANDRVPWTASVAFDMSVSELVHPLMHGATVIVLPREQVLDVAGMVDNMRSYTVLHMVPGLVRQVIQTIKEQGISPAAFDHVRMFMVGGDAVLSDVLDEMHAVFRNAQVHIVYGPTETTSLSAQLTVERSRVIDRTMIGSALPNSKLRILDRNRQLVPIGVPGELYIGGDGVGRGYFRREDLSQEKYVWQSGERWYRSGDEVRYLADGMIEFLGRIDTQIKIRGFRMEIGEIEALLCQLAGVKDATVIVREERGDKRLVAYVIPEKGASLTSGEIRRELRTKLPDYMVPQAVMFLDKLPVTVNGKVDRRALPAPDYAMWDRFVEPRNETERSIAAIWSAILPVEQVGAHDNFFDLGGHSLLATQAISRINQAFGADLPLRLLFDAPTVSEFAEAMQARLAAAQSLQPITTADRTELLPLSFAQQRLWMIDRLVPGSAMYNMPLVLRLQGEVRTEALQNALNDLLARHESLRTTFHEREGQPMQVIAAPAPCAVTQLDLTDLPTDRCEEEAKRIVQAQMETPFDLSEGPLIRFLSMRLPQQEHLFVIVMHHIVSDGWSMGVMLQEISQAYAAHASGSLWHASPLPIQYADYAVWQRDWLQADVLEEQLAYWRAQLGGELPVLELPCDHPRPAVQTHKGAIIRFELPAALTQSLHQLGQSEGATLYMVLLAAFQSLLSRYSGQEDICVGTPVAGRNRPETEALIGFFVNTLVMRTDLSGSPAFTELLRRVKDMSLAAYAHQDLPFERVVEAVQPDRDLSRSPLFQVMFALQNAPMTEIALPDLQMRVEELEFNTAKFDLTLSMSEQDDILVGYLEYNTDLWARETAERMIGHFQTLLGGIVSRPELAVTELPLLTPAELEQFVHGWNQTADPYPHDQAVHRLFEEQVRQAPDRIALQDGVHAMTYGELDRRANQVAHHLHKQGIHAGAKVGLCIERSAQMIIGLLAILKTGAAYVPIDPMYPAERIDMIREDCGIRLVLTQQNLAGLWSGHQVDAVFLDGEAAAFELEPVHFDSHASGPDDLIYVTYTSGSTGRPKGVCVPHRGVVRLVKQDRYAVITPEDVILHMSSVSFDAATFEIWGSLLNGAMVALFPPHKPTLEELGRVLHERQVTILFITTALFNQMVDANLEGMQFLQQILVGGEQLSLPHMKRAIESLTQARISNIYGPTECTTFACSYPIAEVSEGRTIPIGQPIANTEMYVFDRHRQPLPVGVPGELYIGGAGVALEYLNRPELTAEAFVAHPYSDDPQDRLYRTGDRVRRLPDGNLDFVGRIDQQVKMRGFRIELGEIEIALEQHPQIIDSYVTMIGERAGEKRLVAYVIVHDSQTFDAAELRRFLKERLPDYMMPTAFVPVREFPLNANGKVDRKQLPEPDLMLFVQEYVAPHNETESRVADLFADVLQVERVGVTDHFFDLGGHSLLATQLVSRVKHAFRVDLSMRQVFEAPTVAELAAEIERLIQSQAGIQAPDILPVPREGALPMSFAQQRLWVMDQLLAERQVYNIPYAMRLRGALRADLLERSLNEIVARHEALRTTFTVRDGQPVQEIHPAWELALPLVDLSVQMEEAQMMRLLQQEAERPFDLSTGPLLRCLLLRCAEQEHVLFVNLHHIVADGWSMDVFVRELVTLYTAYEAGTQSPLPPLPVQYADYACWQREWLQGDVRAAQMHHWRQQLGGELPILQLPTDRPRPAVQTHRGAAEPLMIPRDLYENLQNRSRQQGATLFITLMAAFQTLLYRYSGQEDICVGTPIAGRHHGATEPLIGFFVNTLVLRGDLTGNPTFGEFLRRMREVTFDAYANQDVPFEKVVEELAQERDLSRSSLFQVMLVLQNTPAVDTSLPSVTFDPIALENNASKFDLTLSISEREDGLACLMQYNTDLFDAATIRRMLGHFHQLLQAVATDSTQRIGEMPMLSTTERKHLTEGVHGMRQKRQRDACVHQLIEQQAERTPDVPAVVYEDTTLTYRELHDRADALAAKLRRLGAGPGRWVAVCMDRSHEMIVSLLGILRTGAAYVPIDPLFPQERIAFLLQDTAAPILVTESHLLTRLPAQDVHVICVDEQQPHGNRMETALTERDAELTDPCCIIYTSGSTGRPKGVVVEHRNLLHYTESILDVLQPAGAMHYASVSTIAADLGNTVIFPALCTGGTLHIMSEQRISDPEQFADYLQAHPIDCIKMVPSHLSALLNIPDPARVLPKRCLILGGESLSWALADQIGSLAPSCRIINHYGPTETTVGVLTYSIEEGVSRDTSTVPIGYPLSNTQAFVLDRNGQPVPYGVIGELYIGGDGVTRGYLGQPELTQERFRVEGASSRLYRTGDLVRRLPNDAIEFVGRTDDQVKIRGYRIETGEIKSVLDRHPNTAESCVLVREDRADEKRLAAYIVPQDPARFDAEDVRSFLQQKVPGYMVPAAIFAVPAIPLTPNGKIDRGALLAQESARPVDADRYAAPRNETEQKLVAIWERLLGVPVIGIHDNFFRLGGHSLLAVRLSAELRREFGRQVALTTLFQAATIEALAEHLHNSAEAEQPTSLVSLQKGTSPSRPVFLVHPVGGSVFCYAELADLLADRPVYGLQSPGLTDDTKTLTSVEEMAAAYIREIQTVQQSGPYLLGGWSLGGGVACEMAQQLRAAGEEVELLMMFDTYCSALAEASDEQAMAIGFAHDLAGQLGIDAETFFELATASEPGAILQVVLQEGQRHGAFPNGFEREGLERLFRVYQANQRAYRAYVPQRYEGRTMLVTAEAGNIRNTTDRTLGWNAYVPSLDVHMVPGDHFTMMQTPHVHELAARIKNCLEEK